MKYILILMALFNNQIMATNLSLNDPITVGGIKQKNFSSNLPLVIIDTYNNKIKDEPAIKGRMFIISPNKTHRASLNVAPSYAGYIQINIRGKSSKTFPKKQYSIRTVDNNENKDDVSLLGMPQEHKWVLYAPYSDKSMMRNYFAYKMTRKINTSKYYAPRSRYVEVLIHKNGSYHNRGIYLLTEKIKKDTNRINIKKIKKINKKNISGGYILKLYKNENEKEGLLLYKENKKFEIEYPRKKNLSKIETLYISTYLRNFQNSLYSEDFNITSSPNYYGKWIDVDSFIIHFLAREFFLDVDSWMFSEYLHKDRHGKLYLSTIWDFNLGMGNENYKFKGKYKGWAYQYYVKGAPYTIGSWIQRLMSDPSFHKKVISKWHKLRATIWSDKNMSKFIDKTYKLLKEASKRNFKRWYKVLGKYVWPNRKACIDRHNKPIFCKTFKSAVYQDFEPWILNRAKWMDVNL